MNKDIRWNLGLMYSGDDDPEMKKDMKLAEDKVRSFVKKWKERDDYLKDPQILAEAMDEYEKLNAEYGLTRNVGYYWWLRSAQDEDDTEIKAQVNKIHEQEVALLNEIEFFSLRVAKIEKQLQRDFLEHESLEPYHHYLERLFETAKYNLSEDQEKIVNLKQKTSHSNWVDMVSRFIAREEREVIDEDGKKKKKSFDELLNLLNSDRKKVRDAAAVEVHDINKKYSDVAEAEMNSVMENKKFDDELRGYERPDSSRHLASDIKTEVVDAMISAVTSKNSISRKYYKVKAQLLGQDRLAYHERNVRYGDITKEYSFDEAVDVIRKVFKGLDDDFLAILNTFFENGHFDVFPRKNKSGGAFCARDLKISPVYILLNYNGKFDDILTIAHEVGHGINDEMMRKEQNAINYGVPLSVAEVASTFFEDFVLEALLEDADEEMKLTVLMQKMNDDISTIMRQTAAYSFEQELHDTFRKEGYLSKEKIGKIFNKHMKSYMGTYVTQDKGSENWWVYWSHFRRFFYVFSYSSGQLISKALQSMVRSDPDSISKVKKVLSAGTSASPSELFAQAGIDITDEKFWLSGLGEVEQQLKDTEELAKKLGKIKS